MKKKVRKVLSQWRADVKAATRKLGKDERELHILLNEVDDYIVVDSTIPKWTRKLERLGYKPYSTDRHGAIYRVPLNTLTLRRAERKKRAAPTPPPQRGKVGREKPLYVPPPLPGSR